jgi:hypothetical protein
MREGENNGIYEIAALRADSMTKMTGHLPLPITSD